MLYKNYIGFIGLGGLSPEIQFNTRVIYILKKLAKIFFQKHFEQFGRTDQAEIWYDYAGPKAHSGKLFCDARSVARVIRAKNVFLGVVEKRVFRE